MSMLRILVPMDGSEASMKAIEHLIGKRGWFGETPEVHLINVQTAFPSDVTFFLKRDEVRAYHQEQGMKALAEAQSRLDAAGMRHFDHVDVGDVGEMIARYTVEKRIDLILLGTRALGAVAGILLGSVASKIVREAAAPVLLVK
jgi:nucleotide-binding universal stress UspA family protein